MTIIIIQCVGNAVLLCRRRRIRHTWRSFAGPEEKDSLELLIMAAGAAAFVTFIVVTRGVTKDPDRSRIEDSILCVCYRACRPSSGILLKNIWFKTKLNIKITFSYTSLQIWPTESFIPINFFSADGLWTVLGN